jgi:hypothetical protein
LRRSVFASLAWLALAACGCGGKARDGEPVPADAAPAREEDGAGSVDAGSRASAGDASRDDAHGAQDALAPGDAGAAPPSDAAPLALDAGSFSPASQLAVGTDHACVLKHDGTIACWGDNRYGQSTPPDGAFTSLSAGDEYTCAIRVDGTVACWGSTAYYHVSAAIPPAGTFVALSASGSLYDGPTCTSAESGRTGP